MSYYLHFWTKSGHLDRVPYPTVEEAVEAAWKFERDERIRITGSDDVHHNEAFSGKHRPKMVTVITDENNNDVETRIENNNGEFFRLKHLLWGFKHSSTKQYYLNEHHWADQFELASRGINSVDDIVCPADCSNCQREKPKEFLDESPLSRDEQIRQHFTNGKSRKEIAELTGVSYQNVCRIIREQNISA